MELLQLKYFCDAAKTQNFSKTAKKYGVPPSDISQSIKRLERELSAELFTRSANKIELNKRGEEFYNKIKSALDIIDSASNTASQKNSETPINIFIGVNRRPVMQAIEKFSQRHKDISIITTHNIGEDTEKFDIIIGGADIPVQHFSKEKVLTEDIVLAYKKGAAVDNIENQPFITMSDGNSMYKYTLDICSHLGFTPQIALQSEDPFYIRKCVELGLGIALVPSFSWQGMFSGDIEFKNIGDFTRDTYIYIRKQKYGFYPVAALYEMIKKEFNCGD